VIDPTWRRIAGVQSQDDGLMAAVWMAHDKASDVIHLYDACIFRREVMAVIAEGLNARGRWIPVAWDASAKDMTSTLLDRGVNILPEPCKTSQASAEVVSREIWERMRTGRFKVDKRLAEWLDEYKSFYRQDAQVPLSGHPLMSATRYAVEQLPYARRQAQTRAGTGNFPKLAIV
jgi:hypothetical protein